MPLGAQEPAPLRVLAVYWGRRGGGSRHALGVSRALAAHGDVDLTVSFSRHSDDVAEFRALRAARLPVGTYARTQDVLPASLSLPLLRRRLVRHLRETGTDVVLTFMFHPWHEVLRSAAAAAGVPYVATAHDATVHPGDGNAALQLLVRRDASRAAAVIVPSEHVRRTLITRGALAADRIHVIPLGPHAPLSADPPRALPVDRPLRLLFLGRIRRYKGLELLRDAYALLRREGLPVELVVAGAGPGVPDFGGVDGVRVQNTWLSEGDMAHLFSWADVLVTPYLEASQSGVITIAAAHGVPVVSTPVGGLVEQLDRGRLGAIASEVTAAALAASLAALARDPARYATYSEASFAASSGHLSWAASAAAHVGVLRDVAGRP